MRTEQPSDRSRKMLVVRNVLEALVEEQTCVYVGSGSEVKYGLTNAEYRMILSCLREGDYRIHYLKVDENEDGVARALKILTHRKTGYLEVWANKDFIIDRVLNSGKTENA